jgi:VanZ family protein
VTEIARKPERGFFIHVAPALLYVGAIFYGGSVPPPQMPGPSFSSQDKLMHALAFGIMLIAMVRAVRYFAPDATLKRVLWISFALVCAAGGALELWQMHIPNRSAELLDFLADSVGAGLVALAIGKFSRASA